MKRRVIAILLLAALPACSHFTDPIDSSWVHYPRPVRDGYAAAVRVLRELSYVVETYEQDDDGSFYVSARFSDPDRGITQIVEGRPSDRGCEVRVVTLPYVSESERYRAENAYEAIRGRLGTELR